MKNKNTQIAKKNLKKKTNEDILTLPAMKKIIKTVQY